VWEQSWQNARSSLLKGGSFGPWYPAPSKRPASELASGQALAVGARRRLRQLPISWSRPIRDPRHGRFVNCGMRFCCCCASAVLLLCSTPQASTGAPRLCRPSRQPRPAARKTSTSPAATRIHALAGFADGMHAHAHAHAHPVSLISVPQPRGCARQAPLRPLSIATAGPDRPNLGRGYTETVAKESQQPTSMCTFRPTGVCTRRLIGLGHVSPPACSWASLCPDSPYMYVVSVKMASESRRAIPCCGAGPVLAIDQLHHAPSSAAHVGVPKRPYLVRASMGLHPLP
jgi:hypothetical protein